MSLPKDPYMLLSVVNMKLRDEFENLQELCASLGVEQDEIQNKLMEAGYRYAPALNRFISSD